jgi:hypothetical protein
MDSTDQTAPRDSEFSNKTTASGDAWIRQPTQPLGTQISSTKLRPGVTLRLDNANSHKGHKNNQRIAVTGDTWIRQPKQPLGTQI